MDGQRAGSGHVHRLGGKNAKDNNCISSPDGCAIVPDL